MSNNLSETAKANEIELLLYLKYLQDNRLSADMKDGELECFAPWSEAIQQQYKVNVE